MKPVSAIISTILFIAMLFGIYAIHILFFPVDVVFYSAILDAVIAAILSGIVLFAVPAFRHLNKFEKLLLVTIWLLGGYAFAISGPAFLDRSLSLYILEKLQQRDGGIRLDRFADVFTEEYVREHRLVDVRLTEQMESGTVIIDNGCVKLTAKGRFIASLSRQLRRHWLAKKRLLMGSYSDDLTDPFREAPRALDYGCR